MKSRRTCVLVCYNMKLKKESLKKALISASKNKRLNNADLILNLMVKSHR